MHDNGEQDGYTPAQRQIFGPYPSGLEYRYADPLFVSRKLRQLLGGDPAAVQRQLKSANPAERDAALDVLIPAARAVFGMAEFDPATGGGANEADVLSVYCQWCEWVALQKKSGRPGPTSPPATEEQPPYPVPSPTSAFAP